MKSAIIMMMLAVGFFLYGPVVAQVEISPLFLRGGGGIFSPLGEEIQNSYGSGGQLHVGISTLLGKKGRLRINFSRFCLAGNPFYRQTDFVTRDAATLTMHDLALLLELGGDSGLNPLVYAGAGVLYSFGYEEIPGNDRNAGDGLGMIFVLSPELQISNRLAIIAEASFRLHEATFRSDGRIPYQFNLSGGTLSFGLAYRLSKRKP